MEKENKQAKAKSNLLKLLPKAAHAVTFQNLPYSPSRDKRISDYHNSNNKLKAHVGRGFSGPMISKIPAETRRKLKNDQSIGNQEPTSPKVSCMGQIKHKHKKTFDKAKSFSLAKENNHNHNNNNKHALFSPRDQVKKQAVKLKRMFTGSKSAARKSFDQNDEKTPSSLPDRAPGLSQMKRFASGRDTFASFDWTAHQIAPEEIDHRNYSSDEEGKYSDQEQEVIIPFSAPIMLGNGVAGLQARKEINLWKRRTMNPPAPLQLNSVVSAN